MKKLNTTKIAAVAVIAAVLFGFTACEISADDSSNLALAVLLGQKSGGTADTPEQPEQPEQPENPEQPEQPATGGRIAKAAIVIGETTFDKTA